MSHNDSLMTTVTRRTIRIGEQAVPAWLVVAVLVLATITAACGLYLFFERDLIWEPLAFLVVAGLVLRIPWWKRFRVEANPAEKSGAVELDAGKAAALTDRPIEVSEQVTDHGHESHSQETRHSEA